ncbi:MAG: KilA-N domain-containing protein, partial [Candidatus Marithrix sp.]
MITQNLIIRDFHGTAIRQRSDGYFDATSMCQATGKRLNDYFRLKSTKEFLTELSESTGLPIKSQNGNSRFGANKGLMEITHGGNYAGTWIHSKVAIYLAIWCSPKFAVLVTDWVYELFNTGSVSLNPEQSKQETALLIQTKSKELDNQKIIGNAKRISLNNFIEKHFGYNTLAIFEMESQPAEIQQALLIPTLIAKQTGLKGARLINVKLIEFGLQTKHHDNKDHLYYQLTEKGLKYGQYQDFSIGK